MQQTFGGIELQELFENGYRNLKKNVNTINELNVFPVPDGDTGTNMAKTFGGGLLSASGHSDLVGEYMKAFAKSVLMSARGNSGVILSQFVHGLYRGFENKDSIIFDDWAYAFELAVEDAYKSIVTPTEGTILTVIREASVFLNSNKGRFESFKDGFSALASNMKSTLAKTPEMLPVLKEAGVVDSGGAGLVCLFEGMLAFLCGETIEDTPDFADSMSKAVSSSFGPDSVLEYGYCTEFILQLMNAKTDITAFDLKPFTAHLETLGDSIVAVVNGDIVKIHIHTFTPEKVLEYARTFGEFVTLKIENMSVQHNETVEQVKKESYKYAIVAVASGEGIIDYFYNIGATIVIDGGQTNNPSVDAFIEAFKTFDAEHIILLPNNSNIILTANQAAELYTDADVRVIPTKSVMEGYSALSMMNLWSESVEELIEDMSSGLSSVTTAYLTNATRDAFMDGIQIKAGQYIGLADKTILSCGDDMLTTATDLIDKINSQSEKDVITVFYGADVSAEQAEQFRASLERNYPYADIGLVSGKQDIYSFIISLE